MPFLARDGLSLAKIPSACDFSRFRRCLVIPRLKASTLPINNERNLRGRAQLILALRTIPGSPRRIPSPVHPIWDLAFRESFDALLRRPSPRPPPAPPNKPHFLATRPGSAACVSKYEPPSTPSW